MHGNSTINPPPPYAPHEETTWERALREARAEVEGWLSPSVVECWQVPPVRRCWLFHRWRTVKDTGKTVYQQCARCEKRRVWQREGGCYQPICREWVETGEWTTPRPPRGYSGVGRWPPQSERPAAPKGQGVPQVYRADGTPAYYTGGESGQVDLTQMPEGGSVMTGQVNR